MPFIVHTAGNTYLYKQWSEHFEVYIKYKLYLIDSQNRYLRVLTRHSYFHSIYCSNRSLIRSKLFLIVICFSRIWCWNRYLFCSTSNIRLSSSIVNFEDWLANIYKKFRLNLPSVCHVILFAESRLIFFIVRLIMEQKCDVSSDFSV